MLNAPFSFSLWARIHGSTNSTQRAIFSFQSSTRAAGLKGYNLFVKSNTVSLYFRVGIAWKTITPSVNYTDGAWQHYCATFYSDGDDGYLADLWIDGEYVDTVAYTGGLAYTSSQYIFIGDYLTALLDVDVEEFAIWNVKLADAEITRLAYSRLANHPLGIQSANLTGFWRFDEMNLNEDVATNPKNCNDYSGRHIGAFAPAGTGNLYGRGSPLSRRRGVRMAAVEAGAAPSGPFVGSLALVGVGR